MKLKGKVALRFILLVIAGLVIMTILALLAAVAYSLNVNPLSEGEWAVLQVVIVGPILFGLLLTLSEALGSRTSKHC